MSGYGREIVCACVSKHTPGNRSEATAVTRLKSSLVGRASWLCSHPTGGEAGGEMRKVFVF